jgi:PBP1b-binding outer membrane lipoprotein LpoB
MTRYSKLIFLCLLPAVMLNGCSGDEDKKPGVLQEMTDKVAGEAVQNIRQPIERAKQVQAMQDAHTKAVHEAIEESNR